jgi:uncharacterized membrane protein
MKTHVKIRRWRRIALPISLIINVFFVAIIGGHWLQTETHRQTSGSSVVLALAEAKAVLSKPDAKTFLAIMGHDAPRYMPAAQQLDAARTKLERQLTATPFDEAATRQAMATWEVSWNRFMNDISDPFIEALGQISPQGRIKLMNLRKTRGTSGNP